MAYYEKVDPREKMVKFDTRDYEECKQKLLEIRTIIRQMSSRKQKNETMSEEIGESYQNVYGKIVKLQQELDWLIAFTNKKQVNEDDF